MEEKKQQLSPKKYKRIIRKYYEHPMPNWTTQTKMDKFLETYDLLKLNKEDSENLNRLITPNEIEAVIKKLPTKALNPQVNFTKYSKKN